MATPAPYGSSQARGWIWAPAASLQHSHSNTRSEPHLWPIPQLTTMLDPWPTEQGQRLSMCPHGYQSGWLLLSHDRNSLILLNLDFFFLLVLSVAKRRQFQIISHYSCRFVFFRFSLSNFALYVLSLYHEMPMSLNCYTFLGIDPVNIHNPSLSPIMLCFEVHLTTSVFFSYCLNECLFPSPFF